MSDMPNMGDTEQTDAELRWFMFLATNAWSLGRKLRRAMMDFLHSQPISDDEFFALTLLADQPSGISQVEIAQQLEISTAQTSGLVERLRCRGWVNSTRDPHDRRRQLWRLEQPGKETLQACYDCLRPLVAAYHPDDAELIQANIPAVMQQLISRLSTIPLPPAADSQPQNPSNQRRVA